MKPCEKQTKSELINGTCNDLGIGHGLSGLKKGEIVDLCCEPDGIKNYLKEAWKGCVDVRNNTLIGDAILTLDKPEVLSLLKEKKDAPSKAFWSTISGKYGITKGNLFGNPVKCEIPVPPELKSATMLVTSGDDVYDNKDAIKNDLGGTYFPQLNNSWAWHLDKCKELAETIDDKGMLLDDVIVKPCTVYVFPFKSVTEISTRFLDPEPLSGMFSILGRHERTADEAMERVNDYKDELSGIFGIPAGDLNEQVVMDLVSDPSNAKYFHEKFGTPPSWMCGDAGKISRMIDEGTATIIDRDAVPFDEYDVSPSYLERQREVLPRVAFQSPT